MLCLEQFQYIAELNAYLLKELNGYTEKQQQEAEYTELWGVERIAGWGCSSGHWK